MENNHLSILLRSNGFSFCILNRYTKEIDRVEHLEFGESNITSQNQLLSLQGFFKENLFLTKQYKSVSVTHCNNLSTFVPNPFFKKDSLKEYLQYTVKVLPSDFITYDPIESADMINVYIPFVHFNNFLFDQFGSFEFKHSSSILVDELLKKSTNSRDPQFFVNVEKEFFQITIIQNKKLIFYNAFNFSTKEDFIYYILFTAEQLKLNPEVFKLILLGKIEKDSEFYEIVYTYVRHVEFYNATIQNIETDDKSNHSNFILLNQHL